MAELTGTHQRVRDIVAAATAESAAAFPGSMAGRLLQPARYGGLEIPADEFISVVCELAVLDGSLGWLTAVFNAAAYEIAGMPEVADEVWNADPNALIATSCRAEGRFGQDRRLSGRWTSVVGAEFAEWLLLPANDGGACRVLVPRSRACIDSVRNPAALGAAGISDVTISEVTVDERHIFRTGRDRVAVIGGAGMAAAVVGSADGVWRKYVDQVRARLATSYSFEEVTEKVSTQVAWAASDIDAAKLQVTTSLQFETDCTAATWAHQHAVARARGAADRLLGSSRHALDASDPVTRLWRDVHAGCRLAVELLDGLESRVTPRAAQPANDGPLSPSHVT